MKKLIIIAALITMSCAGPKGADGHSVTGDTGATGDKGDKGDKGDVGDTGPAGADGSTITVVPLCPGVSNYGTFVEVSLCINNKLYAVYSANGGFMTYLAPGNYSSNAIGSACNLTVQPNCVVVSH